MMETLIIGSTSVPAKLPSPDGDVSLVGDFVSFDQGSKIRQWIEDIDAIDNINSRNSMLSPELQSVASSEESRYGRIDGTTVRGSDTDPVKGADADQLFGDDDFDVEDDFFVEAAHSALEKGKLAFAADDFKNADALLRESLTMLKELARKQQAPPDTWELRRILGVCAFHVHTPTEAEDALLSVLKHAPKNAILTEGQRLQVSETAHLLSQVYVKLGQLDKAYRYCEYALRGRRRVLGKNHNESYESLAVMARILELQENSLRAEFFVDMIPEGDRSTYVKRFAQLALPTDRPSASGDQLAAEKYRPPTRPAPPVSMRRVISSGGSPPAIPERSPSRGVSGTPPRSRSGTLQSASHLRNVSSISSDSGDITSRPSISPLQRPDVREVSRPETLAQTRETTPLGIYRDVTSHAHQETFLEPESRRISSETSEHTYRPTAAQESSLIHTVHESSHNGTHGSDSTGSRQLRPQPLKPQQLSLVSELPGDTQFGTLQVANGSSPTLPQSLEPSQNLGSIENEARTAAAPLLPTPSDGPLTALPAIPQSENIQDRSISAPVVPQAIIGLQAPAYHYHPADRQSLASSNYSESISASSPQTRSTAEFRRSILAPDAAPEFKNAKVPEHRRKISLLSKLRKTNSTTDVPRNDSILYNGVRLSKQDVDSIKSDYLTDNVIDFWQEHLEHEVLNHSSKFVLMRPVRASLLLQEAGNPASLKAALPDFSSTLHVMMPLKSPRSGHWSLLLISAQDGLACHYDSRQPRNRRLAEVVSQQIAIHLGSDLTFLDVPDTPTLQKDQDCGVFVCFFMQHLITKINMTHVSQKVDASLQFRVDAKMGRKMILKVVKEHKKKEGLVEE